MNAIQKFLAFIGISAITMTDSSADFKLTEEQMAKANERIAQLEAVEAAKNEIAAQLEAQKQLVTSLEKTIEEANKKIEALELDLAFIRKSPGASTATSVRASDGNKDADPCKIDLPEGASIQEQFSAFMAAFRPND